MKDYAEGRGHLEPDGRFLFLDRPQQSWRAVAGDFFYYACLGAFIGVVIASLQGCATVEEPVSKVCYMKVLGHADEGIAVVLQSCMSPEAFAEAQK